MNTKIKQIRDVLKLEDSSPQINKFGEITVIIWKRPDGIIHRKYGPAVECINGTKKGFLSEVSQREEGSEVELNEGSKSWYLDGKLHREDGPAVELARGQKEWWIKGKKIK